MKKKRRTLIVLVAVLLYLFTAHFMRDLLLPTDAEGEATKPRPIGSLTIDSNGPAKVGSAVARSKSGVQRIASGASASTEQLVPASSAGPTSPPCVAPIGPPPPFPGELLSIRIVHSRVILGTEPPPPEALERFKEAASVFAQGWRGLIVFDADGRTQFGISSVLYYERALDATAAVKAIYDGLREQRSNVDLQREENPPSPTGR